MTLFHELDMMARGGSLGLLALWSWVLWRDHRKAFAARVALTMNLAIAAHIVASAQWSKAALAPAYVLLDLGSSAVFGLFWLFTRAWFEDAQRFGWKSWALALGLTGVLGVLEGFDLFSDPRVDLAWFPAVRIAWFAFGIGGLWIAWRGRDDDLVEERRRMRLGLVGAVGGLALLINCVEIAVFHFGAPAGLRSLTQFGIAAATALLCSAMFRLRQADLFGPIARTKRESAVPDDDPLALRLRTHMEREKAYRDEALTIARLAAQLGEQEYRLRRLINHALGYRNFSQFLNGWRLAEVKAALADPTQREVPILTIALDAGFGSLGPFNRAFRESEGMTPSEYRRSTT